MTEPHPVHLALTGLLMLLAGLPLVSRAGEPLIVVEDCGGTSALPYGITAINPGNHDVHFLHCRALLHWLEKRKPHPRHARHARHTARGVRFFCGVVLVRLRA